MTTTTPSETTIKITKSSIIKSLSSEIATTTATSSIYTPTEQDQDDNGIVIVQAEDGESPTPPTIPPATVEEPYTLFPKPQIIVILLIASLTSMISPLTASIYLPALNQIEIVRMMDLQSCIFLKKKNSN